MASVVLHTRTPESSELPLVLLAPFPLNGAVWDEVAGRLGGDVITVDPPGFGGEPDAAPSLESYVRALLAALDARGVRRFVVAGNSMGGYAALCLAELAPSRVAGIGLFGTKSSADAPEAITNRLTMAIAVDSGRPVAEAIAGMKDKLLGASSKERPDLVAALDGLINRAATPAGVAWAQRAMAGRPDRTDVLADLRADGIPGCVVWGVEDALMGLDAQQVMADALGIEVTTVPDCGHLIPLEAPDAAASALRALWDAARR